MLVESEMKMIAKEECVEMLGKDFVYSYKDLCCPFYGYTDSGLFQYGIGMDIKQHEITSILIGEETKMEYYAIVTVDPEAGDVTRDYENSTLPNK